jgi:hypothetical protein
VLQESNLESKFGFLDACGRQGAPVDIPSQKPHNTHISQANAFGIVVRDWDNGSAADSEATTALPMLSPLHTTTATEGNYIH